MANFRNFSFSTLNFFLKSFNSLVVFGILVRYIGLDNFGFINYLITLITLIFSISIYGYRMQIVKEVAADNSIVTLNYIIKKVIVVFIVYIVCLLLSIGLINRIESTASFISMLLFCSSAIFLAWSGLFFAYFQAINKFKYETYCQAVFTAIQMIGLIGTAITGHMRYFASAYVIGVAAMGLVSIYFFYKLNLSIFKFNQINLSSKDIIQEFKVGMPFALITAGDILLSSIDIIILERLSTMYDVGMYSGVIKIVLGLIVLSVIFYSSLLPYFCAEYYNNDGSFEKQLKKYFIILLFIGLSAASFYLLFYNYINNIYLGKNFSECSNVHINEFRYDIAIITFFKYMTVIPAMLIIAGGSQMKRAYWVLISILLCIFAYYIVIPKYGVLGAFKVTTYFSILIAVIYFIIAYSDYQKKIKLDYN